MTSNRPLAARLLAAWSDRLPLRRIDRSNGAPYLLRYWVGRLWRITVYLHHFLDEDGDEWLHDHPWRWSFALCLSGGYDEQRLTGLDPVRGWLVRLRRIRTGRTNLILGRDFHRITRVRPNTWTLFVHGPRYKRWGFIYHDPNSEAVIYHQPYDTERTLDWHRKPGRGLTFED